MEGRRYYTFRRNERRLGGVWPAPACGSSCSTAARSIPSSSRGFVESWRSPEQPGRSATSTTRSTRRAATPPPRASCASALEPILVDGDVDVVLTGHEHFYERIQPQHGISYFVSGGAGSLRKGDITPSPRTARGFDTDYTSC